MTVPSFRPDLEREIDLIEEVLRVWGMGKVPATLPAGRGRVGELTREQRWRERVGAALRASGLNETMTYSFADPVDLDRMRHERPEGELCVELLNPMSGEQATLRRSLLPGLLRSVAYNQNRGVSNVHLYEIGSVFRTAEGRKQPKERAVVAGVLAGAWHEPAWNDPAIPLDFFDGKGIIETLARDLGVQRVKFRAAELPYLQPGRSAEVLLGGQVAGWIGEVHPAVLEAFEADAPVTAFELDLPALVREAVDAKPYRRRSPIPRSRTRRRFGGARGSDRGAGGTGHEFGRRQAARIGPTLRRVSRRRRAERLEVAGVRARLSRPGSDAHRRRGRGRAREAGSQGVGSGGRGVAGLMRG